MLIVLLFEGGVLYSFGEGECCVEIDFYFVIELIMVLVLLQVLYVYGVFSGC